MQQITQHTEQVTKAVVDSGIGVAGLSSPIWLTWIENGLGLTLLILSVILVGMRVVLTYREYKKGTEDDPS